MAIKKKKYTLGSSAGYPEFLASFFITASELLGSEWECAEGSRPSLRKKTSDGYYGWIGGNTASAAVTIQIGNSSYTVDGIPESIASYSEGEHTCVVWEGSGGSIGIGEELSGRIHLSLIAAKFNGQYDGHDIYALGTRANTNTASSLYGYSGIRIDSGINMSNIIIGTGVYLHPIFDPTTGLACSDVFGVQCYDSDVYKTPGMVVKQGGISYISALGARSSSLKNILFVKI